jgi:hypothetical protein
MSARRDHSQNASFVFTNFYHLYKQNSTKGLTTGVVLKSETLSETPAERASYAAWAKGGVRESMKELRDAGKRLEFLARELEELLKRS